MSEEKTITGKFRFDQDSKRYHRFQVETNVGVGRSVRYRVGNLLEYLERHRIVPEFA